MNNVVVVNETIRLANIVIETNKKTDPDDSEEGTSCVTDQLLGYMLENYTNPQKDQITTAKKSAARLQDMTAESINLIPEELIPVAVMRFILGTMRCHMCRDKMPNWYIFVDRFQCMNKKS